MMTSSENKRVQLLGVHKKLQLANANEAETRKKLIDEILEGLLGWTPDDMSYEERISEDGTTTYADYILRTANTPLLIEAKRMGRTFDTGPSKRRRTLSGPILDGEVGDAIRQARDYCRKKNIPYAVVTNGGQWIVFPAVRTDEVDFHASSALVFDSLESTLGEDFEYFTSLLSRDGVIDGNLEFELIGRNADQLEERRLNRFFVTGRGGKVNPIYPLIENEIITAFSESISESDTELLDKCYVTTPDRTKFDNRIKMHISKRAPLFDKSPGKPMGHRKSKSGRSLADTLVAAEAAARPLAILILGPVGVGKTTFLQYTRKITAASFFKERKDREYPHWIDIDFREYAQNEAALNFVIKKIKEYFSEDDFFATFDRAIRSAYREELETLKRGPLALIASDESRINEKFSQIIEDEFREGAPYVERLLKYASSKVPVFLVIDNVDQFEDEAVQSNIFSDAIAFARRNGLNLVLSMRESTFVKHRHSPKFDAFDFDPLQLEPPQIRQVLSRRFFVAERLLQGKSGEFVAGNGALFQVSDLSQFISIVRKSVLGTEVGKTIEMLAVDDTRLSLKMTREFLERGYTDPDKAIRFYQAGKDYVLPKHEALRSILVGNQPVYSEEYSVIGNVFDARLDKTGAELLRVFILGNLVKLSSERNFDYESGVNIREASRKIGFSDDHILAVLSDLCKLRFVHTASHGPAEFSSNFYPTKLGGYILRVLIGQFAFVENMLMDTFIADRSVWRGLYDISQAIKEEREIRDRLVLRSKRAKQFFDYMVNLYQPIVDEARRRGLPAEWCSNPLEEMKPELAEDCSRALRSAKNIYSSK